MGAQTLKHKRLLELLILSYTPRDGVILQFVHQPPCDELLSRSLTVPAAEGSNASKSFAVKGSLLGGTLNPKPYLDPKEPAFLGFLIRISL